MGERGQCQRRLEDHGGLSKFFLSPSIIWRVSAVADRFAQIQEGHGDVLQTTTVIVDGEVAEDGGVELLAQVQRAADLVVEEVLV